MMKSLVDQTLHFGHRGAAALLFLLTVLLLGTTAPSIGVTWDEPAYITASEAYSRWFADLFSRPGYALSADGIHEGWDLNHEHPPLDKIWSGLVWSITRPVVGDLLAHRLGNILLAGGLVALLYLMVAEQYGSVAGIVAALSLMAMPRFFFHAHLASLDVAAAVMMFAVVMLFWRTHSLPGRRWSVLMGVAWGLALATKINALFVLPALGLWIVLFRRKRYLLERLVIMGLVSMPIFLVVWPWLYHDSLIRLAKYIYFVTIGHWKLGQWYLHRFWMPPPWHFPFVMVLAVVPLGIMLLSVLGIWRVLRERRMHSVGFLFIFGAFISLLVLATGGSMVYDNERLLMPAFPNFAALAGIGFGALVDVLRRLLDRLNRPSWVNLLAGGAMALVFAPPIIGAADLFPHLLSYYSAAVGGVPGATRLGLESTYWCDTYVEALPYLNAYAQPGDIVWVEDWSFDPMLYYQREGRLRRDIRITWPRNAISGFVRDGVQGYHAQLSDADWAVVQYHQTGMSDELLEWIDGREPVHQLSYRGVPLMELYRLKPHTARTSSGP